MKIVSKHQAKQKSNSMVCQVDEYPLNHAIFDAAVSIITGRYPDKQRAVNQVSDELVYIIDGEGKIVVNHKEHCLSAGDVILIEAGEKFFWEGNMKLFISCQPVWKEEQHQFVD